MFRFGDSVRLLCVDGKNCGVERMKQRIQDTADDLLDEFNYSDMEAIDSGSWADWVAKQVDWMDVDADGNEVHASVTVYDANKWQDSDQHVDLADHPDLDVADGSAYDLLLLAEYGHSQDPEFSYGALFNDPELEDELATAIETVQEQYRS